MGTRATIGALFVFIGAVWIAQGLDLLKGSPMTGELFWAGAGTVMALVGAALIARDVTIRRHSK